MLFDNLFTLNGFLGDECRSFLKSDPSSVPFAFSHALLDALMKIVDLLLRLVECRLDLLRGESHEKVIYQLDIALEEIIHGFVV